MKSLEQFIKESQINEGAGAGYEVTFDGLKVKDVKLVGKNEIMKDGKHEDKIRKFEATLDKCVLDVWKAEGYYDGVTSDGVEYDGDIVLDYGDDDKTVEGGVIKGYVMLEDVEPNENNRDYDDVINVEDNDIIEYIKDNLNDFKVATMYGGGYSHSNLGNPIVLKNIEIEADYDNIYVDEIQIKAPNITKNVNWFFAHCDEFDEMFGDDKNED